MTTTLYFTDEQFDIIRKAAAQKIVSFDEVPVRTPAGWPITFNPDQMKRLTRLRSTHHPSKTLQEMFIFGIRNLLADRSPIEVSIAEISHDGSNRSKERK